MESGHGWGALVSKRPHKPMFRPWCWQASVGSSWMGSSACNRLQELRAQFYCTHSPLNSDMSEVESKRDTLWSRAAISHLLLPYSAVCGQCPSDGERFILITHMERVLCFSIWHLWNLVLVWAARHTGTGWGLGSQSLLQAKGSELRELPHHRADGSSAVLPRHPLWTLWNGPVTRGMLITSLTACAGPEGRGSAPPAAGAGGNL